MDNQTILELTNVRKVFGQTVALDSVTFSLRRAEIHGLLGGNGAGKTTLMNILYGLYRKDEGEILHKGKKINIQGPKDAIRQGIGMVHQHFLQIGNFTVLENIILGTDIDNRYTMKTQNEEKKILDLCQRFGLDVDLNTTIDTLTVGTRQKVEILKALYRGVDILILDEPTTNLTPQEVDALFESLRVMVNDGLSIVFITHKLREVLSVCDRITVLREGKNITTLDRKDASEEVFVRAMVGDKMDIENSIYFATDQRSSFVNRLDQAAAFEMSSVSFINKDGIPRLKDVSLNIHSGEIVGVSGVAGNGQRELAEIVTGVIPVNHGKILLDSKDITHTNNQELFKTGIAYIPEDRLHDGFLPKANVAQNLILGHHRNQPYSDGNFINWKTVFKETREQIKEYNIKTSGPEDVGGNLSGGNIQRVLIARAFSMPSQLLVAHNPTRGLDIPSMDFVYQKMLKRREEGYATLLISEDLDELIRICDRIAVIYRGEILGILPRTEFDKYAIGRLMSGIKEENPATEEKALP
ncbi:MAG: ABC transporter ATP-binding protein [Anaerolineaceae bacterium]